MTEIELKLQIPAPQRAAVEAAVAGNRLAPRVRLQAAYHDTEDRLLAANRLALRLRREGRQWVQTLKGATDDGLVRNEHNVPRGAATAMPALDPNLHAGTPVGDRLLALLAAQPGAVLRTLYGTDIQRRTRATLVRTPGQPQARVELAFDTGRIEADAAVIDICELEIELLSGLPQAVIDTARRWLPRHGLWIDTRSKAERGDLLARGERVAPARRARPVRLAASMSEAQAWRAVLHNLADPMIGNASQIASGAFEPEHVHQLRVGLRRLRSALALFERGDAADRAMADAATALFRELGGARDAAVVESEFAAGLRTAMGLASVDAGATGAPPPMPRTDAADPVELLRCVATQTLLLDLLAATQRPIELEGVDGESLRERMAARLNRWHRQVVAGAEAYADLDDAARHRLRKRAKRLRYASEFCAGLFGARAVRRYLKPLAAMQERLGEVSDVLMAMAWFAGRGDADPQAMFARGWLAARRGASIDAAGPTLQAFVKVERFWTKRKRRKSERG